MVKDGSKYSANFSDDKIIITKVNHRTDTVNYQYICKDKLQSSGSYEGIAFFSKIMDRSWIKGADRRGIHVYL